MKDGGENIKILPKNQGITLIALIVTIIVLIILAGVALNLVAGSDGILQKATNAVDKTEIAGGKEEAKLLVSSYGIEYYEKKYGDKQSEVENDIDADIIKQFENGEKETAGEYLVKITKIGKVELRKKGKVNPIATGALEDGRIIWGKEPEQTTLAILEDKNIGDYINLGNEILKSVSYY